MFIEMKAARCCDTTVCEKWLSKPPTGAFDDETKDRSAKKAQKTVLSTFSEYEDTLNISAPLTNRVQNTYLSTSNHTYQYSIFFGSKIKASTFQRTGSSTTPKHNRGKSPARSETD